MADEIVSSKKGKGYEHFIKLVRANKKAKAVEYFPFSSVISTSSKPSLRKDVSLVEVRQTYAQLSIIRLELWVFINIVSTVDSSLALKTSSYSETSLNLSQTSEKLLIDTNEANT